jgi:hypothetical protein
VDVVKICCQTLESQLEIDSTEEIIFEAEFVEGQVFTLGCNAIEWMGGNKHVFGVIKTASLRLRISLLVTQIMESFK